MKCLAIDIGNTRTKYAVFEHDQLLESSLDLSTLNLSDVQHGIVSKVGSGHLHDFSFPMLELSRNIELPIRIDYETPETLGADRVALACGAQSMYPNERLLVIDAGTCITYDVVFDGTFHGGIISPGVHLRYKTLHEHTFQLPALSVGSQLPSILGKSTAGCMHSGVINGVSSEIDGIIDRFKQSFHIDRVLLSGGDASLLESTIKNKIFAAPDLLLIGLYRILKQNVA